MLLDENLPRKLRRLLEEVEAMTVPERGWSGIGNGELLRRAEKEFDALLTMDPRPRASAEPDGNCLGYCPLVSELVVSRSGSAGVAERRQNTSRQAKYFAVLRRSVSKVVELTCPVRPRGPSGHGRMTIWIDAQLSPILAKAHHRYAPVVMQMKKREHDSDSVMNDAITNAKRLASSILMCGLLFGSISAAQAQWEIGAGYQLRAANPGQGLRVQVQRHFPLDEPHFKLFMRAHARYFFSQRERTTLLDYESTIRSRSYGASLSIGLKAIIGRFHPYFGIGSGYTRHTGERRDWSFFGQPHWSRSDIDKGSAYIAGYVGTAIRAFRGITPYVEYWMPRYLDVAPFTTVSGIFAAGVRLRL